MDKKRASALTLIVMLTIIVVTPITFTNVANANFTFPPSNPHITFTSPVNTTYTTKDVFLNVTIDTFPTGYNGGPTKESTSHLEYSIDGSSVFHPMIVVTKELSYTIRGYLPRFNCSINLYSLSEGNHTLTVKAAFDYYLEPEGYSCSTKSVATAYLTIDAVPDNTPTPTDSPIENSRILPSELVIPIIAIIILIAVTVSVYYLRIKR